MESRDNSYFGWCCSLIFISDYLGWSGSLAALAHRLADVGTGTTLTPFPKPGQSNQPSPPLHYLKMCDRPLLPHRSMIESWGHVHYFCSDAASRGQHPNPTASRSAKAASGDPGLSEASIHMPSSRLCCVNKPPAVEYNASNATTLSPVETVVLKVAIAAIRRRSKERATSHQAERSSVYSRRSTSSKQNGTKPAGVRNFPPLPCHPRMHHLQASPSRSEIGRACSSVRLIHFREHGTARSPYSTSSVV
jgi:hypothetical protein